MKVKSVKARKEIDQTAAKLLADYLRKVSLRMASQGVNRSELARRLGRSRATVTALFSGRNATLRTMAAVCAALDCGLEIKVR